MRQVWAGLSGAWAILGALPILCCYVASIPQARDSARHTLAFVLVAVGMGMLCFVLSACYLAFSRRRRRSSSSLDRYGRSTETVKNISDGVNIFQVIYLQVVIDCFSIASTHLSHLQVLVNFICSVCLFLVFCQGYPSSRMQSGSSEYRTRQTYKEHAYTLSLLALCRVMGSLFGSVHNNKKHKEEEEEPPPAGGGDNSILLVYFDWSLSISSALVFIIMLATIGSGQNGRLMQQSSVAPDQEWMQWLLFIILVLVYLTSREYWWHSSGNRLDDGKGTGPVLLMVGLNLAVRTTVLVLGCTAFHLNLIGVDDDGIRKSAHSQSYASLIDYEPLRKWGYVHSLRTPGSEISASPSFADFLSLLIQIWMALHTARWFAFIVTAAMERIR